MSLADSLYNLQLILEFCESCLKSCCPLVLEDMLYSPPELQVHHYFAFIYSRFLKNFCLFFFSMCCFVCNSGVFVVQVNMLSFLAELLYWFEVSKPDFVQPLNATG